MIIILCSFINTNMILACTIIYACRYLYSIIICMYMLDEWLKKKIPKCNTWSWHKSSWRHYTRRRHVQANAMLHNWRNVTRHTTLRQLKHTRSAQCMIIAHRVMTNPTLFAVLKSFIFVLYNGGVRLLQYINNNNNASYSNIILYSYSETNCVLVIQIIMRRNCAYIRIIYNNIIINDMILFYD